MFKWFFYQINLSSSIKFNSFITIFYTNLTIFYHNNKRTFFKLEFLFNSNLLFVYN